MERRKLAYWLKLTLLSMFVFFAGCSSEKEPKTAQATDQTTSSQIPEKPTWQQFIADHTQGVISSREIIFFEFNHEIVEENLLSNSKLKSALTFEPALEGELVVVSPKELRFRPAKPLDSGNKFKGTLDTTVLKGFPEELKKFDFEFEVITQAYELYVDGLSTEDDTHMQFEGRIQTADVADPTAVEKIISAVYDGQDMNVEWNHSDSGQEHKYTIKSIERKREKGQFRLYWDGASLGIEDKGSKDFMVTQLGKFELVSVRAIQDPQSLEIRFSEPVSKSQPVADLIQFNRSGSSINVDGNTLSVFFAAELSGEIELEIDPNLASTEGIKLGNSEKRQTFFLSNKPEIRFIGKGVIVPTQDKVVVPFEAVNVSSVQVTAFQIFDNNIRQHLQNNDLQGNSNTQLVGRHIWRRTVDLKSPVRDSWNQYQLDLTDLFKANPSSIFRLKLSINPSNSTYLCGGDDEAFNAYKEPPMKNYSEPRVVEASSWDGIENYVNSGSGSRWHDRSNPCKISYYKYSAKVKSEKTIYNTNIGLIAKQNDDGELFVVATDLTTGLPIKNANIEVFNLQNQLLATSDSDKDGFAEFKLNQVPFLISASQGNQTTYLKVSKGKKISTSHFDVGGIKSKKGIKGFIYGERGVWRPGDDVHLFLVVEDRDDRLPDQHPVTLEFFNPKGQRMDVQINNQPVHGFYRFKLKTSEDSPTGSWKAVARLGGLEFSKAIPIETIKPNRLKIELDLDRENFVARRKGRSYTYADFSGLLHSEWMHGAKVGNLKYEMSIKFVPTKTKFGSHEDFVFDDPARKEYRSRRQNFAKGKLDRDGNIKINTSLEIPNGAAGKLRGLLQTKVFEKTGDFSIANETIEVDPYNRYVGIKLPKGDAARGMLQTDMDHDVEIVVLDNEGNLADNTKLEVKLFKLNWKWWWDKSGDSLARYSSSYYRSTLKDDTLYSVGGRANYKLRLNHPEWGRYLLRVCDDSGDHCTGQVFYMDWPGWAGKGQDQKGLGANILTLGLDKAKYSVGETANLTVPNNDGRKFLVTIETGSKVLSKKWYTTTDERPLVQIPVTQEMRPNAYVSVSMLQPFANRKNDAPIRLMGVQRIVVEDPLAKLQPELTMPSEVEPESSFTVEINESSKRAMTYSLALVDEGLLGITSFRTPNIYRAFNKQEALGISTWDNYDDVVGAYGVELEKLLSIGGDESGEDKDALKDKRRFPPVVQVLGPFHLPAGEIGRHEITIPTYMGSIRTMVIAGQEGAYGTASKDLLVRKPLNAMVTLPRTLSVSEELDLPITLFKSDTSIEQVKIELQSEGPVEISGGDQQANFAGKDEVTVNFKLKTRDVPGLAKVVVKAANEKFSTQSEVNIVVRYPETETTRVLSNSISDRGTTAFAIEPFGVAETHSATLELSAITPLNLENRLNYLIRYPHGCVEQTVSSVLPQLYLNRFTRLSESQQQKVESNIKAGIDRLRAFQLPEGDFAYWPGQSKAHPWANNYVGQFLLSAKEQGYAIPSDMLTPWIQAQREEANMWRGQDDRTQAYRLYTLALANSPALSAMNRLKSRDNLSDIAKWLLAASYQIIGQRDVASNLVSDANSDIGNIRDQRSFSSHLRNDSLVMMAMSHLIWHPDIKQVSDRIANQLSSKKYLNTHGISLALTSQANYIDSVFEDKGIEYEIEIDGNKEVVKADKPIFHYEIPSNLANKANNVVVKNLSEAAVHGTLFTKGLEKVGEAKALSNGFSLSVNYLDGSGNLMSLNKIKQGTDVSIAIEVSNQSEFDIDNIALTHNLPVGWEIHNERLAGQDNADLDYQDVRDDSVKSYFSLKKGQSKQVTVTANAAFSGKFYVPAIEVKAMYEEHLTAKTAGQWVEVVKEVLVSKTNENQEQTDSSNTKADDSIESDSAVAIEEVATSN